MPRIERITNMIQRYKASLPTLPSLQQATLRERYKKHFFRPVELTKREVMRFTGGQRNPFHTVRLETPLVIQKFKLAKILAKISGKDTEKDIRRAMLFMDYMVPDCHDVLFFPDQIGLLAEELSVAQDAIGHAKKARLMTAHAKKTHPEIMKLIKAGFDEARDLLSESDNKDLTIERIFASKCKKLLDRITSLRSSVKSLSIGHACMRVGSRPYEEKTETLDETFNRIITNIRMGHLFLQALNVYYPGTYWMFPCDVTVYGASGRAYMDQLWEKLYETGYYNIFAFQTRLPIYEYYNQLQGGEGMDSLKISSNYLDGNNDIISPFDTTLVPGTNMPYGTKGVMYEWNKALDYLRGRSSFKIFMFSGYDMPDGMIPAETLEYKQIIYQSSRP